MHAPLQQPVEIDVHAQPPAFPLSHDAGVVDEEVQLVDEEEGAGRGNG